MELHKALRNIIQTDGPDILKDIRLVNILDDFNAYKGIPASKYILRAIIAEGYSSKLLEIGKWDNATEVLINKFATVTGFIPEYVSLIFQSIAYGLGWINENNIKYNTGICDQSNISSELKLTSTQVIINGYDFILEYCERAKYYLDSRIELCPNFNSLTNLKIKVGSTYRIWEYINKADIFWNIEVRGDIIKKKSKDELWCFNITVYDHADRLLGSVAVGTETSIKSFAILRSDVLNESIFRTVGNIGKIIVSPVYEAQ